MSSGLSEVLMIVMLNCERAAGSAAPTKGRMRYTDVAERRPYPRPRNLAGLRMCTPYTFLPSSPLKSALSKVSRNSAVSAKEVITTGRSLVFV